MACVERMHSCDLIHTEQVISDLLRGDAGSWQEIEQDNTWYVIVRQVHTYTHVAVAILQQP